MNEEGYSFSAKAFFVANARDYWFVAGYFITCTKAHTMPMCRARAALHTMCSLSPVASPPRFCCSLCAWALRTVAYKPPQHNTAIKDGHCKAECATRCNDKTPEQRPKRHTNVYLRVPLAIYNALLVQSKSCSRS